MLNALEMHGQGCALLYYNPRQSNSKETKNEKLSTNLNNAFFADSDTNERNQKITLLASNQKLNQLIQGYDTLGKI